MHVEIAAPVLFGIISFTFAFLAVQIDKKHGLLQFMFLILSLSSMYMGLNLLRLFFLNGFDHLPLVAEADYLFTLMNWLTWIIYLLIAYFVITFAFNFLQKKENVGR
jgi:hypothetical protein